MSRRRLLLGAGLVLALLPRLAAIHYNIWPHGDVLLDAATADSLAGQGLLRVPIVDIRFYPIGRFGFGYPPDQHPPLWALLAASLRLAWPDSYEALKLLSLTAGLLLVPAVYLLGRDLFGRPAGLAAALLCAASYLLIDFSGNGSLWSLLALLYVLFVWRLAVEPLRRFRNAVLVGLLMGSAYLTNYPAVVLPATLVLVVAARWAGERCGSELRGALLASLVAALICLPWLVFNLATFGNPIWSQPLQRQVGGGDTRVEVVLEAGEAVKRSLPSADAPGARLRATAANVYGNIGFLARQSFVLLPFTAGLALSGFLLLARRSWRRWTEPSLPLVVLTLLHGALIVLWPTTKFRYLVPLFPLAAVLAGGLLVQLQPAGVRALLIGTSLALTAFTSAWTWASIPSHTYYYDGGVVGDNFGGQGETAYIEEIRRLEKAAGWIREQGPGVVLGPHPLYALTRQPLVVDSGAFSAEIARHLVDRYSVRYVVAEPARLRFYASLFPGRLLWQDERLGVYALR